MTDVIERLKELCSNQIADPSIAPEFVFLDPDLPVSEWEKQYSMDVVYVRADRIEELVKERDVYLAERNKFQLYLQRTYADLELEVAAVDALNAKLAKAVEVLRPFAKTPETWGLRHVEFTFEELRPARTLLAELEGE